MAILSTGVSLLSVNGGGAAAMFNTVADMKMESLNIGDVVETAGFYSVNDGGACKYQIQASGTANGMDLIQMNDGKIAKALFIREAYPEQIGYEVKPSAAASADLTPYLSRLLTLNIVIIRFHAKGYYYYMKTPLEITKHNTSFIGDLGTFSGFSSRIEYVPNASVTQDYCFKLNARRIKFENLYLNEENSTHACFKTDNPNGQHEGYVFNNLNIHFDIGFSLCGSVNWQHEFNKVWCNQCRLGLYTQNTFFMNNLTECYFSCTECDVYSESEYNAVTFTNCNFECLKRCVHLSYWRDYPHLDEILFTLSDVKFICCSFEFHTAADVPRNTQGCFIYVDDIVQAKINLDTQNLSLAKLANSIAPAITDTTCFSFGENTYCTFVSVRGQDWTAYWASKFLWDTSRHPAKDIGAVTVVNSYNIPLPEYEDKYLPTFRTNDNVIYFSNSTDILNEYPRLRDGTMLFNLDDGCYYTKSAERLIKVTNSPNNMVRVGTELYEYVVIGNKKWITRNLLLNTTNSHIRFSLAADGLKDKEFGCYYPFSDKSEITNKLPSGWRIPTQNDFNDLISSLPGSTNSEKAWAAQALGYNVAFPNATNTSGLKMPPSSNYDNDQYTQSYFMGNSGKLCLVLKANEIYTYDYSTDAPNLQPTLRICADV